MIDPCKIVRNAIHDQRQAELKELWKRICTQDLKDRDPADIKRFRKLKRSAGGYVSVCARARMY